MSTSSGGRCRGRRSPWPDSMSVAPRLNTENIQKHERTERREYRPAPVGTLTPAIPPDSRQGDPKTQKGGLYISRTQPHHIFRDRRSLIPKIGEKDAPRRAKSASRSDGRENGSTPKTIHLTSDGHISLPNRKFRIAAFVRRELYTLSPKHLCNGGEFHTTLHRNEAAHLADEELQPRPNRLLANFFAKN